MPTETSLSDFALLAPVAAGQQLRVIHGYNDPLPNVKCVIGAPLDHCANQRFGLDLRSNTPLDERILAPLPGRIDWIAENKDCLGIRTRDDLNLTICHFTDVFVSKGQQVSRGAVLGIRRTSWIHLSLDDRHQHPTRPWPAIPFNGNHTIEGESFEPGAELEPNVHVERRFVSTNGSDTGFDCAQFARDLSIPDGAQVSPGATFLKRWQLENCGNTTWNGYQAVRVDGSYGPLSIDVSSIAPDALGEVRTDMTAPSEPGLHRATYQLRGPHGNFGQKFWVEINVTPA